MSTLPTDLGFFLGGVLYPNNSAVSLAGIGEGVDGALYCLTNLTTCCSQAEGGVAGEWLLPTVPADPADYTISRGPSAVLLNKNNEFVQGPTGIFTCRIPDGNNQTRTLYIGVDTGS